MKYINLSLIIFTVLCITALAVDIYYFHFGVRLDWRNDLVVKYQTYGDYEPLAKKLGWINHVGAAPDGEDPSVSVRVWPNLMRRCRKTVNKESDINIAFINASYTFGMGVKDEDTFVYKLNERYPDVTFDNYGVCGYGPAQCAMLLKEFAIQQKKYDLIVYNFYYMNLFANCDVRKCYGNFKINSPYLLNSRVYKDIFGRYKYISGLDNNRWPFEKRFLFIDLLKRSYLTKTVTLNFSVPFTVQEKSNFYENINYIINKMKEISNAHGADFMICCLDNNSFPCLRNNITTDCPKINLDYKYSRSPEYRVLNNRAFHPNYKIHDYWFRQFSKWFDNSKYMK